MLYKEIYNNLVNFLDRPNIMISRLHQTFGNSTAEEIENKISFAKKYFSLQNNKDYDKIKEMIDNAIKVADTDQDEIIMLSLLDLPEPLAVYFLEGLSTLNGDKIDSRKPAVINEILTNSGKNFSEENQIKYAKRYAGTIVANLPQLKQDGLNFYHSETPNINIQKERPENFIPQNMIDIATLECFGCRDKVQMNQCYFIASDETAEQILKKLKNEEYDSLLSSPVDKFQFEDRIKNALLNNDNLSKEFRMKIAEDCNIDFKLLFGVPKELLEQYYLSMVSAYTEQELNPSNYKDRIKFMTEHKIGHSEMYKLEAVYEDAENTLLKLLDSGRLSEDMEKDLTNRLLAFNLKSRNPVLERIASLSKTPSVCLDLSKSKSVIIRNEALSNPHIPLKRVKEVVEKRFEPLDKKDLHGVHYDREVTGYKMSYLFSQIQKRNFGEFTDKLLSYPSAPIINSVVASIHTPLPYLSKFISGGYDKTLSRMTTTEFSTRFLHGNGKDDIDNSETKQIEVMKKQFGAQAYFNFFVRSKTGFTGNKDRDKVTYKYDKFFNEDSVSYMYDMATSFLSYKTNAIEDNDTSSSIFQKGIIPLTFIFLDNEKLNKEEIYKYQDFFKEMYKKAPDYLSPLFECMYNEFKSVTESIISINEKDAKSLSDEDFYNKVKMDYEIAVTYPPKNFSEFINNPYFKNLDTRANNSDLHFINRHLIKFERLYRFSQYTEELEEAVEEIQRRNLIIKVLNPPALRADLAQR